MSGFTQNLRARTFGRLLFLQSCWSYESMQGVGLSLAMEPWLEKLHGARAKSALARYAGCFNTHPFMAPMTVGMLCGLEEEAAAAPEDKREALLKRADALKTAVACALAGIGDAFFWGALRPACAAAAMVLGLLAWRARVPGAFALMALSYLALYNVPALWLRWRGLDLGYRWRSDIAVRLKNAGWQGWILWVKRLAVLLLLGVFALLAADLAPAERAAGLTVSALFFAILRMRPVTTAASFYGAVCALGILGTAAGWI